MKLEKMKIRSLLALGFGAVLALMLVLAGVAMSAMNRANEMTHALTHDGIRKSNLLQEWKSLIEVNAARTIAVAKATDPAAEKFFLDAISKSSERTSELQKLVQEATASDPEGKRLFESIVASREAYRAARAEAFRQKKEGQLESAARFFETDMLPKVNGYTANIEAMVAYQKRAVAVQGEAIDTQVANSRSLLLVLSAAAVVTGIAFAWLIMRAVSAPLQRALGIAQTVARGDLSARIEADACNETGQLMVALKDMRDSLRGIVSEVRGGTDTIASAAHQISGGNLELSSRTEEQASSLEETASAMEELTATVRQNADNAQQANALARTASGSAARGGETVGDVVRTMAEISSASQKIGEIVGVIDGIAFQTNILALNAAVEAARAGEQGRGFAVVASEVRALAQRSATAAKEIKTLIGDSAGKVDEGTRLVAQAGSTMEEIVAGIAGVSAIMAEIAAASDEQSLGIEQINQAVTQMDQVTQENAALVEEAAAASDALREQAQALSQLVATFRLDEREEAAAPTAPRRTTSMRPALAA
ncbi:methyl-accepting chemotaxis protein [Massilia sp. 9I]|uniref:methyl-accepting chemotaxis protein n=1 Tax=Massilia sp. 9I TaxID=2653152 RepID=UPI0012F3E745|nr:methyl-accepting chemotaxis protein [Massilia sp. 9I]VXB59973.1 Methyl-accepting chemotaxis protein I [Massilia sp. 9I]